MSKKQYIQRHLLIINKLKSKSSSFEEIKSYLKKQEEIFDEDFDISKRTFQRDLKEINSIFEIEITYNKKEGWYEIVEDDLEKPYERIIEAVETINAISISNSVSNKLILEKKKSSGTEHMYGILQAIENNLVLKFEHRSYWKPEQTNRTVEPIAIKESQNRWYLVGFDAIKNDIRNFGLDRITNLEITSTKFKPKKIDVTQLYTNAVSIETYEPATKVVLKFDKSQSQYIKSLPLHHSQLVVEDTPDFCIVQLFVHPTFDFILELLKQGELVEVLEPKELRNKLKERLEKAAKQYRMTFQEFKILWEKKLLPSKSKELRDGQWLMICLNEVWANEYSRIVHSIGCIQKNTDCFYNDKIIPQTWHHLEEFWENFPL